MTEVFLIILILIVVIWIVSRAVHNPSAAQNQSVKTRPPKIIYPPKRTKVSEEKNDSVPVNKTSEVQAFTTRPQAQSKQTEIPKVDQQIAANKAVTTPILIDKVEPNTNKPFAQSQSRKTSHRQKQKPKFNTATDHIKKVENFSNNSVPLNKTSISSSDKDIYKQAEKQRTEENERRANERNRRYFEQMEYEKKLSRKGKNN